MSTTQDETTHEGKLKWFDSTKGYGFIQSLEGGPDVFLHNTVVAKSAAKLPEDDRDTPGVKVKYRQKKGEKGFQAGWVEVIY
jgi:cold shock CspA family protein